jgi:GTP1/Obg family GTP-binding protein
MVALQFVLENVLYIVDVGVYSVAAVEEQLEV